MFTPPVYNVKKTERVQKLRDMLGNKDTEVDLDRMRAEMEVLEKYPDEPRVIQRALMFENLMDRKEPIIYDGELIVGTVTSKVRASYLSGELMAKKLDAELDDPEIDPSKRYYDRHLINDEERKELREVLIPYFLDKTFDEYVYAMTDPEIAEHGFITKSSCAHIPSYADMLLWQDAGHCVPNHEKVIAIGLNGIKDEIAFYLKQQDQPYMHFGTEKRKNFYKACLITIDAVIRYAQRYAAKAASLAKGETDAKRREELMTIADICSRIPAEPAHTWQEALQAIWFINVACNCEQFNFGIGMMARFDVYMKPFYDKAKADGMSDDEILEILECFFIKTASFTEYLDNFSATQQTGYPMGQTMNMGGELPEGGDASNEVTWAMLEADAQIRLFQPDLGYRIWDGTPDIFLRKCAENLALGFGKPKFYGEKVCMKEWARKYPDLSEAELHDCIWIGCQELQLPYITQDHSVCAMMNVAKILEMTLHDGKCAVCGQQMGPQTGDPRTFKTMDEFLNAYNEQLKFWMNNCGQAVTAQIIGLGERMQAPFASSLHEGPLNKGMDLMEGGAWYTEYGIMAGGLIDSGDSLVVIDKLIYRDKACTWDELLAAIDADWEGYEDLRQRAIHGVEKFGNDNDYADGFSAWLMDRYVDAVDYLNTRADWKPSFGGIFISGTINGNTHIGMGYGINALPNGRKAGTPLADTTSPVAGMDTQGAIAVLNSFKKTPIERMTLGVALNQRLDPCLFETDEDLDRMVAYFRTINDDEVEHIQFNVVSNETLRAAQKEPDKYRDLIVRVATYCSYFTELSPDTQEQIISRSEHKTL